MPEIDLPLFGLGLVASSGNLIAAGGETDGNNPQSNVYKFDFKAIHRNQIASLKYKRKFFGLLEIPSYDPMFEHY